MKSRLDGLDGLRAISIALVMVGHSSRTVGFPAALGLGDYPGIASTGVVIFFGLSGFLITWLLLQEESRFGGIRLGEFYFRRALRILPAAFTYLTVIALAGAVGWIHIQWKDVVSPAVFLANLIHTDEYTGHFWTLSVEEQFYLVWPALLVLLRGRQRILAAAGWVLFTPIWRQINLRWFGADAVNWSRPDLRFDTLMGGCLLALLWMRPAVREQLEQWTRRAGSVVLLASIAAFTAPWWMAKMLGGPGVLLSVPVAAVGICGIMTVAVTGNCRPLAACLNWPPCMWIGRLSYSLYLWQQIFCYPTTGRWHERFPQNIGLTVLVAAAAYYLIELPCLRLRDRLQPRLFPPRPIAGSGGSPAR